MNLKYIILGIPLVIAIVFFALSDDLINHRRFFLWCFIAAFLSFIAGLILFFLNIQDISTATNFVIFSVPIIYLVCFESFRIIFKHFTGENPCITSVTSRVGDAPFGGIFSKYPKSKRIKFSDFAFSFCQGLVPISIIFVLVLWLKK